LYLIKQLWGKKAHLKLEIYWMDTEFSSSRYWDKLSLWYVD